MKTTESIATTLTKASETSLTTTVMMITALQLNEKRKEEKSVHIMKQVICITDTLATRIMNGQDTPGLNYSTTSYFHKPRRQKSIWVGANRRSTLTQLFAMDLYQTPRSSAESRRMFMHSVKNRRPDVIQCPIDVLTM